MASVTRMSQHLLLLPFLLYLYIPIRIIDKMLCFTPRFVLSVDRGRLIICDVKLEVSWLMSMPNYCYGKLTCQHQSCSDLLGC